MVTRYQEMFNEEILPQLFKNYEDTIDHLWFMQDGARYHRNANVRDC